MNKYGFIFSSKTTILLMALLAFGLSARADTGRVPFVGTPERSTSLLMGAGALLICIEQTLKKKRN
jgi:hypothetical protein